MYDLFSSTNNVAHAMRQKLFGGINDIIIAWLLLVSEIGQIPLHLHSSLTMIDLSSTHESIDHLFDLLYVM